MHCCWEHYPQGGAAGQAVLSTSLCPSSSQADFSPAFAVSVKLTEDSLLRSCCWWLLPYCSPVYCVGWECGTRRRVLPFGWLALWQECWEFKVLLVHSFSLDGLFPLIRKYFMCYRCLACIYVHATHVCLMSSGQKLALDSLELEKKTVVSLWLCAES